MCEGFFFLYVVVFLFFSFRFFLICHLFLIYPLFIIFVLPRLELNQRRDMCIPCFSVLLLKEISSISPDTISNTTRVKTRIKQHAKMESCGARRGDTHITEPAQGYVYPLFFVLRRKYRQYHLTQPVTQQGLRQESNNMQRWNDVALAGGYTDH